MASFALCQNEQLACQVVRRVVPRSNIVEDVKAAQRREQQLWAIPDLVAVISLQVGILNLFPLVPLDVPAVRGTMRPVTLVKVPLRLLW